jgi:predicted Asp-tRNA(Asn)/Glu-tRNA(Gln) amidotransferase subunit C
MAYTWHAVTEDEKEEIKKNAKHLLDEFSHKLEKIKTSEAKTDSKENLRPERSGWTTNKEFQELMLDNAPMVEDGFIIAEKGAWKK